MKFRRNILSVSTAAITLLLAGCGGGGGGANNGGTDSGLLTNEVSIGMASLSSGQATSLSSHAVIRGGAPTSMKWTITPIGAMNAADLQPQISDVNCASATISPPAVAGTSGEGVCRTLVTVPVGAKTGAWRLTNTAISASSGSISGSVDLNVVGSTSGFALVQTNVPLNASTNTAFAMNMPFTVTSGASVSNVVYTWAASASNPSTTPLAGATTSMPTFIPKVDGIYSFDVQANAMVNGTPEMAQGSVIVNVTALPVADQITAGIIQTASPGDVTVLFGSISSKNTAATYTENWSQLPGTDGGPTVVNLSGANSGVASFIAPQLPGTYNFRYRVVKTLNGTQVTSIDQTSVVVTAGPTSTFIASAGNAQTASLSSVVVLQGTVTGGSANAATSYAWTQVQPSPAVVTLSNANTQAATFIPTVAGTYLFDLTVTQTKNGVSTAVTGRTQVIVGDTSAGAGDASFALTANAGAAQSTSPNSVVTLNGGQASQGSTTGATYTYEWVQSAANPAVVTLSNATTATPSFIPTIAGVYDFTLTVTAKLPNGTTYMANAVTQVAVGGASAFTVSAGDAQVGVLNTALTLPGVVTTQGNFTSATFDYQWTQVGAAPAVAVLSNATTPTASFIPTVPGTYEFDLAVTATNGGVVTTKNSRTQVLAQ